MNLPQAEVGSSSAGARLVVATRSAFPMVSLRLAFRGGAGDDPAGREGLTAFAVRMLDRGTRTRTREQIASEMESMGGSLSLSAGMDTVNVSITSLSRNLSAAVALAADLILEPAFKPEEIENLRREMTSELALAREEDRDLADAFFRRAVYGSHPYGHFVEGTQQSLAAITAGELSSRWKELAASARLVVSGAGDIDLPVLQNLIDRHLGGLPAGKPAVPADSGARALAGVEVLLVDKPDRNQTQIFLGATAVGPHAKNFIPFLVANHAFGGMFTAPLMQEVRVKRGWSYGAYSRLEMNRGAGLTGLWTFPATGDTLPCIRLLLDLYRDFKQNGVRQAELDGAKGHLLNMLAFEVETPEQVVARRMTELLLDLPDDWTPRWMEAVQATTLAEANAAAREVTPGGNMVLAVVCTAQPLMKELTSIPEIRSIDLVPFDAPDPDIRTRLFERASPQGTPQ